MSRIPDSQSVLDVRYGIDPDLDALLLHFMTENNLEYTIDPLKNASPEQLRFVVALPRDTFYAPCTDWMFRQLLKPGLPDDLLQEYILRWKALVMLVRRYVPERYQRRRILSLCRHKFRLTLSSPILLPSRLMKRMITIFLSQSGLDDPARERKQELNRRAKDIVDTHVFDRAVNVCPSSTYACTRLDELRRELNAIELRRLMLAATVPDLWVRPDGSAGLSVEHELMRDDVDFTLLEHVDLTGTEPKIVLYLPNCSGGVIFDVRIVKLLLRLGHKVVMALKEGFYFDAPTFWDRERDPVLAEALSDAHFVAEDRMSKNELLHTLRENSFVVISDGTRERLNPYRFSVTMARAWKECDVVLAKGELNYRRLLMTSHEYTRDVVCFFRDHSGVFHLLGKPKAEWVGKFGEAAIRAKAGEIITAMRQARGEGKTVMFYSGIIGSIPGQTTTAIEVMNRFIEHLRTRLDQVFVINPGEHFEEGMDADDLMYMWEMVQRSGLLNVWRFQTDRDIEQSFELMGKKVPPVWAGKDATYSTGCTKEMHIALDMQKRHPELQIIGPSPDKFFRRREYGVGKFCDVAIDQCN